MNTDINELIHNIVEKLSRQFDEIAVLAVTRRELMTKIWNSEPSITQLWSKLELNIRIVKSRRLWVLSYETHDPEILVKHAEEVAKIADKIMEAELYAPLPDYALCKPLEGAFDYNAEHYMRDPSRLVDVLVSEALGTGVERVSGTIALSKIDRLLVTSRGYECGENKTEFEVYARAFKGDFTGHWAYGSTRVSQEVLREVGRRAGLYATITKTRVDFTPGEYDVILSPLVVGNLFDYVASMASALAVLTGFSMFAKYKLGDRVAADTLSLHDVPRDPVLPGAVGFDDEGVETSNKPIIDKGVLVTLLHNAATAVKMNTKSTGNAGWVRPHPWNLEIPSGDIREEELIRELRSGIFITNNWYTRLQNYYEGHFSTVSRDVVLLVKNGDVVGHVGRVRLASNFSTLMKNLKGLSRERFNIWWWEVRTPTRAPFIIVSNIRLTRPEA